MNRLLTFGAAGLRRADGRDVQSVLAHPKRLALLVYLATAQPGPVHRRDTLLGLFWPEQEEAHARASLRKAVHLLRQSLGADTIVRRGDDELGIDPERLWTDVAAFETALGAGRFADAVELYRGPFLAGLFVDDAPEFERWLTATRLRLERDASAAAQQVAESREAAGDPFGAAEWARRALALVPHDEQRLRFLLGVLERVGDRAGALAAYDTFARRLADEFDDEPGRETQRLIAAIRSRSGTVAGGAESAAAVVDNGAGGAESARPFPAPQTGEADRSTTSRAAPASSAPWFRGRMAASAGGRLGWRRLAVAAATVALVLAGGAWFAAGRGRAATTVEAIAVMPFTVRGSPHLEHLGDGMVTLLSANFDAVGEVRSVDPFALLRTLKNSGPDGAREARTVAGRLGARYYVVGEVLEVGGELRLTASLYDRAQGGRSHSATVQGASADLFALVDRLTARLIADRVTDPALRLARIGAHTTQSLPALNAFLRGEREYREGRYHAAADHFRAATEADTTFALAYYRLSSALSWAGLGGGQAAARSALRHAGRLAETDRLLVEAALLVQDGRPLDAEPLYRRVLAARPDDLEAWNQLGELLFHWKAALGGSLEDARTPFERVTAIDPKNANAFSHLARIAGARGDQRAFTALASQVLALDRDGTHLYLQPAVTGLTDDVRSALASAGDGALMRAALTTAVFGGDVGIGIDVASELTAGHRTNAEREAGYILIAGLEMTGGRWSRARDALAEARRVQPAAALELEVLLTAFAPVPQSAAALDSLRLALAATPAAPANVHLTNNNHERRALSPPRRALMQGLIAARTGDFAAALAFADALAALTDAPTTHHLDVPVIAEATRIIRAYVDWRAGRAAEGLARLGPPTPVNWLATLTSYPHMIERLLRAELHRDAGQLEDALRWYGTFPDATGYDHPFLPLALLRRAQLLEETGDAAHAAAHYVRFTELWRGADPGLRELALDAANRAAALRAR
jgi:DNA-binding SARP family transcriptional activator/tetratricopeptide (TPR) repeat protein